jgi:hypothetical protein
MGYDNFSHDQPLPMVTSYISKAHYGMTFKEPFDDTKHGPEDRREYDAANGTYLAWDQMHWYVRKVSLRAQESVIGNLLTLEG